MNELNTKLQGKDVFAHDLEERSMLSRSTAKVLAASESSESAKLSDGYYTAISFAFVSHYC